MIKENRYSLLNVGISGLAFQKLATWLYNYIPKFISANQVTTLGFILSITMPLIAEYHLFFIGFIIIIVSFLDFLDGIIARKRNTTSEFGGILDATTDIALWVSILISLYLHVNTLLPLIILVIYIFDLAWRHQLKHSTSLLELGNDRYIAANNSRSKIAEFKKYYYPAVNYYDSLAFLAIITIAAPNYSVYWLIYELVRRILLITKKIREIIYIYKENHH